jgi:hypothetical protein
VDRYHRHIRAFERSIGTSSNFSNFVPSRQPKGTPLCTGVASVVLTKYVSAPADWNLYKNCGQSEQKVTDRHSRRCRDLGTIRLYFSRMIEIHGVYHCIPVFEVSYSHRRSRQLKYIHQRRKTLVKIVTCREGVLRASILLIPFHVGAILYLTLRFWHGSGAWYRPSVGSSASSSRPCQYVPRLGENHRFCHYRIDSGIRDTSVSAIALVFSFFQYARPLLFWAFHIMIGQLLKKTKENGAIPQNGSVSYTRVNTVFHFFRRHFFFPCAFPVESICFHFAREFSPYAVCVTK